MIKIVLLYSLELKNLNNFNLNGVLGNLYEKGSALRIIFWISSHLSSISEVSFFSDVEKFEKKIPNKIFKKTYIPTMINNEKNK